MSGAAADQQTPADALAERLLADPGAAIGDEVALRASRCPACERVEFPRLDTCPSCSSVADEIALGPDAILVGSTEVLHPPPGALVETPYTLGVAAFDGNLSVMGLMEQHISVDELPLGTALRVCVVPYGVADNESESADAGGGRTYGYRPV